MALSHCMIKDFNKNMVSCSSVNKDRHCQLCWPRSGLYSSRRKAVLMCL